MNRSRIGSFGLQEIDINNNIKNSININNMNTSNSNLNSKKVYNRKKAFSVNCKRDGSRPKTSLTV